MFEKTQAPIATNARGSERSMCKTLSDSNRAARVLDNREKTSKEVYGLRFDESVISIAMRQGSQQTENCANRATRLGTAAAGEHGNERDVSLAD